MTGSNLGRRALLRTAGLVAAGAAVTAAAGEAVAAVIAADGSGADTANPAAANAVTAARTDVGVSVYPFPLSAVALLDSPFKANMTRTMSYLSYVNADRLLHTFRLNAGLASSAQACGGWETPSTELRGHSTGHVMSALAQAYLNTGDSTYKTKGDYLVAELAKCQAASPSRGYRAGYLSAFPENFFDRLESGQSVWAPYYTIHKIMAGLLDQYLLAGNAQALTVVTGMASWVKVRTDRLTTTQMQSALNTEFGGMPEVLTNLYQVTGDANHLTAAQRFDHATILNPLASNTDQLAGKHANTQIPKITGAIREYHATGTTRYRDIARNFWDIVIARHTYAIGGNSNGEYFQTPNAIASQLSDSTCECCNTYNMLKLTRQLFFTDPSRADYLDYYERALYNQVLASQNPNSSHGFVCYYIPLRAGGIKTYSNDYDNFTCCHGTGMESQTKFADSIYFFSGETLYVNLFIPSVLTWPGRGIAVRQETSFPESTTTKFTITGSGHIALKLRVPSWVKSGYQLKINGTVQSATATPGQYLTIDRTWNSGDVIEVTMPAALTFEPTPDNANVQALRYGAIVLSGEYGSNNLSALPTLTASSVTADPATPLRFTGSASTGSVSLIPFYKMHNQRYTVYWTVTGGGTTPPPPPPQNIAWYKFDETSGTSAADAFGNGKTATLAGGASWVAGRSGNAVSLSGSSQYVSLPAGILAGASDFTIATWVRLNAINNWSRVFDFGTGTSVNMFLTPSSSSGTARFAITTGGSGGEQRISGPSALPTGSWTHVAVTLSGSTGVLYVNGAEVARNASISLRPSSLGSTTQNYLGRSQYADPYLNGALDNFRIYGRALSASEINNLYTTGT